MSWASLYQGDGVARDVTLPAPPPWRTFPRQPDTTVFQPPVGLVDAVNAALCLRRPLLITGMAGSGKSTVIESVTAELKLGRVLRWHITSRSTSADAKYQYDVLGRIYEQQLGKPVENIGAFVRLGPLGTALMPSDRPRALLIDEIDKSDLDLPSDLLDVLERGEFDIPELVRYEQDEVQVREWDSDVQRWLTKGQVQCTSFPFIVMTSNGERDFPAAFLRRCVRFEMPIPDEETLTQIIMHHLDQAIAADSEVARLIHDFAGRLRSREQLAIDQLLNTVFLLGGDQTPHGAQRQRLEDGLLRDLSSA